MLGGYLRELGADTTLTETFVKMGGRRVVGNSGKRAADPENHPGDSGRCSKWGRTLFAKVYVPICKSGCPYLRIRVSPSACPDYFFFAFGN